MYILPSPTQRGTDKSLESSMILAADILPLSMSFSGICLDTNKSTNSKTPGPGPSASIEDGRQQYYVAFLLSQICEERQDRDQNKTGSAKNKNRKLQPLCFCLRDCHWETYTFTTHTQLPFTLTQTCARTHNWFASK